MEKKKDLSRILGKISEKQMKKKEENELKQAKQEKN